jgi:hypothetical protein
MRWLQVLSVAASLAGCGGGVWIGIGDGFDDPPDVSVAVTPESARAGDTLRLVAAAADDFGISRVSFFRIESDGTSSLLTRDDVAPFQVDTVLPATSATVVRYFARAVDDVGQVADSATVSVTVLP